MSGETSYNYYRFSLHNQRLPRDGLPHQERFPLSTLPSLLEPGSLEIIFECRFFLLVHTDKLADTLYFDSSLQFQLIFFLSLVLAISVPCEFYLCT